MARKPVAAPVAPAKITYADVMSVKALAAGVATDRQQQIALKWIIEEACNRYGWPYETDPRATDINLGRMRVGMSILDLVNMPHDLAAKLKGKTND